MAKVIDFSGATELLAWAEDHAFKISALCEEFSMSKPCEYVVEPVESGEYVHKLRLTRKIPVEIQLRTFDCINALRSSLDHAIFSSFKALLGREPKDSKFPSGEDEARVRDDAKRKMKATERVDEILEVAYRFQPWNAGDQILYALNKIRNVKNHQMLAEPRPSITSISMERGQFTSEGAYSPLTFSKPKWNRVKQELTIFRSGRPEVKSVNVEIQVIFGANTLLYENPVVPTLFIMCDKVNEVVSAIALETRRMVERSNGAT